MIVLASDYIGYKVIEFLVNTNNEIDFLVLDQNDKGEFNQKIISLYKTKYPEKKIYYNEILSDGQFIDTLKKSQPTLGILAWWPNILKGEILHIPRIRWLNFHPSLLPFNRGKNPNFWCLVDETKCGVSLQFIDEGVDTGDIIAQREIKVDWEDTGKTVYEKCLEEIVNLFKENFENIKKNQLKRIEQKSKEGSYHKAIEMDEICKIKLDKQYSAKKLLNILRAKIFSPYPSAFFYHDGKKYSVEIKIKELKENE